MAYHEFSNGDSEPHGSFEVFYHDADIEPEFTDDDGEPFESGWYWWACFPGCLPDGDACGPFDSESEAISDANDFD